MSSSALPVPEMRDAESSGTASAAYGGSAGPPRSSVRGHRATEEGHAEDQLADALELVGASNEMLPIWAAAEANILDIQQPPRGPERTGGTGPPLAIPDEARRVCQWCMRRLIHRCTLPVEAWFSAATLFDAYVRKAGDQVAVVDLPFLCTVLVRMQCKEDEDRRCLKTDWFWRTVAQSLADAGYAQATEGALPTGKHDLTLVEMRLLETLGWQVNVPNLANWTTAYFNRLQAFAPALERHRIVAAWQSALSQACDIVVFQAPSAEYPPQRLAQGLLLLHSAGCGAAPAASPSPGDLVAATGCATATLQEDCALLWRVVVSMGPRRTADI